MQSESQKFLRGVEIKRSMIHDRYGGSRQAGISVSGQIPAIFLFTSANGRVHGYEDGWTTEGLFRYTGEGQRGDMQMTRGNLALRDHSFNGKRVYLFQKTQRSHVALIDEIEVHHFERHSNVPDTFGQPRTAIVFYLEPLTAPANDQIREE